jgi:hypothetical protein
VLRHSGRELEECTWFCEIVLTYKSLLIPHTVVWAFSILLAKGGRLCGPSEVGCGEGWRIFLHGAARAFDMDGQRSVVTDAMFYVESSQPGVQDQCRGEDATYRKSERCLERHDEENPAAFGRTAMKVTVKGRIVDSTRSRVRKERSHQHCLGDKVVAVGCARRMMGSMRPISSDGENGLSGWDHLKSRLHVMPKLITSLFTSVGFGS